MGAFHFFFLNCINGTKSRKVSQMYENRACEEMVRCFQKRKGALGTNGLMRKNILQDIFSQMELTTLTLTGFYLEQTFFSRK